MYLRKRQRSPSSAIAPVFQPQIRRDPHFNKDYLLRRISELRSANSAKKGLNLRRQASVNLVISPFIAIYSVRILTPKVISHLVVKGIVLCRILVCDV